MLAYQLKQHFEGARLPNVLAERGGILTVHAIDQSAQLLGGLRTLELVVGFEEAERLVERVQERHRLRRGRDGGRAGGRALESALDRCRSAVVIAVVIRADVLRLVLRMAMGSVTVRVNPRGKGVHHHRAS